MATVLGISTWTKALKLEVIRYGQQKGAYVLTLVRSCQSVACSPWQALYDRKHIIASAEKSHHTR